ncbi:MAG: GTP-binding protein [Bryobacteraceae bacterium]
MEKRTLVLVNGFLGAGKTTLLIAAANLLHARGRRAALITNDQGEELVDTRMARAAGVPAAEVGGGCFCCRFSDFLRSMAALEEHHPEVIFAEPVGSCTDLAGTLIEALRGRFALAPLTVLVDPARARELLAPDADPDMAWLFRQQLAEADIACFTRADLHADFPQLPGSAPRRLSAVTGEGVAEWLEETLAGERTAGAHPLDIDYTRYAQAEAALGWLNWRVDLRLARALTPAAVVGLLLEAFGGGLPIAHLKVFNAASGGYVKASVCRAGEEPLVDGRLDLPPVRRHELVINLRARAAPEELEAAAARAVRALGGRAAFLRRESFRPAAPRKLLLS